MKTTTEKLFSNSTEAIEWVSRNCDHCIKQSHYNEKADDWTNFRCTVDADIQSQMAGFSEIRQRSLETVRKTDCPFIQTKRNPIKKRDIKGQTNIELKQWNEK